MQKHYAFITRIAEIVFIRRSRGLALLGIGLTIWLAILASDFDFSLKGQLGTGQFGLGLASGGTPIEALTWTAAILAIGLVLLGIWFLWQEYTADVRKKVVVIEARGLRDWNGSPLAEAVPKSIVGQRTQILLDVSNGLDGARDSQPITALRRFSSVPVSLGNSMNGLDRREVTLVVGGLAPVPYLFLLGALLDDEGPCVLMDWDRHQKAWRMLDEDDDGVRFEISGLESISQGTTRVAICASVSYETNEAGVKKAEPNVPPIQLKLANKSNTAHFSESKQQALGQQFLDVLIALEGKGVREISLFLAVPASLAIRFGTLYDKRNLPVIEVNQFERGAFPWAIRVPTSDCPEPELVMREIENAAA
jgi:hypothetical protein